MLNKLHLDFETISAADLAKVGADNYSKHSSTDALCVGFAVDDKPVDLLEPGDFEFAPFLDLVANGGLVLAWNAPFELAIWNNVMAPKYNWPKLLPEQCRCVMAMAYAMGMPGKLENAAPAAGIAHRKDMLGHRIMLQLSQPRSFCEITGEAKFYTRAEFPEKFQKLYDYCKSDTAVERELYHRLMKLSPSEQKIWELDYRINQRGIMVDIGAAKAARAMVEMEAERLDARMREISSGAIASCTAVKQITDWLAVRGFPMADGIGKPEIVAALKRKALPTDVRTVLELRQEAGKSSTAKFETMLSRAGEDGRLRGMFQYHGATTGRWAARGVQLQNLVRALPIENVFEILRAVG